MNGSSPWLLLALAGAGTFLLRFSFLGVVRGDVPPLARRILRLVPAAVLSALVLSALAPRAHAAAAGPGGWARLTAALVAAIVAARTRNVLATLGTGMVALWVLAALA